MSPTDSNEQAHRGTWRALPVGFDAALELLPRALQAEGFGIIAGLLLPCNVVLFERDDGTAVLGVIDPVRQLDAPSGPLAELAREIGARLGRVAENMKGSAPSGEAA